MILEHFGKPSPTERKPIKCPTKEKKSKRSRKERKQRVRDEGAAKLSRKKLSEILLSAHDRISKAVIWHQEQKLA